MSEHFGEIIGKISNFAVFDISVYHDKRLGAYEKLVYSVLCSFADPKRTKSSYASHETIAEMASCSRRTVIDALKKLEDAGYLRIERRSERRATNNYFLIDFQSLREVKCAGDAQQDSVKCAGDAYMEKLNVQEMHTNNSKTENTNNNINTNNKNIAANAESKKTNTLFPMPEKQEKSSPPRIPSKIERAEQTGKWEDVTPTDFVDYFVDRHNELFPSPICRQKSQVGNFLVKMFRVNFMERFQIPPNEVCSKIDLILRTYKRIETNPEYKDCFDLATFKHGRVIDKLMQSARYEDQYGSSIKSTPTAKNNSEIF